MRRIVLILSLALAACGDTTSYVKGFLERAQENYGYAQKFDNVCYAIWAMYDYHHFEQLKQKHGVTEEELGISAFALEEFQLNIARYIRANKQQLRRSNVMMCAGTFDEVTERILAQADSVVLN